VTYIPREWLDKTYGAGWKATKRRWYASSWTPRRCFWCLARGPVQLNHLTYLFVRFHPDHGAGWTPLWTLLPLCGRCHKVETWAARKLRKFTGKRLDRWTHALVTLGWWVASRGALAAGVFALELWIVGRGR